MKSDRSIARRPTTSEHDLVMPFGTPMAALILVDGQRTFGRDSTAAVAADDHRFSQRRPRFIDKHAEAVGRRFVVQLNPTPEHAGCSGGVRTDPVGLRQSNLDCVWREKKDAPIIIAEAERDLNRVACPFAVARIDDLISEMRRYLRGQALELATFVFRWEELVRIMLMQRSALQDSATAVNHRSDHG